MQYIYTITLKKKVRILKTFIYTNNMWSNSWSINISETSKLCVILRINCFALGYSMHKEHTVNIHEYTYVFYPRFLHFSFDGCGDVLLFHAGAFFLFSGRNDTTMSRPWSLCGRGSLFHVNTVTKISSKVELFSFIIFCKQNGYPAGCNSSYFQMISEDCEDSTGANIE